MEANEETAAQMAELRRGRITAPMVGAILGSSTSSTDADAMRKMVRDWHMAADEFVPNMATEYGRNNVAGALIEYTMETGHAVEKAPFMQREHWAGCDVSAAVSMFGAVMVRCPFSLRDAKRPVAFKPISDQQEQYDMAQYILFVTGFPWLDFFQWTASEVMLERIKPDPKWKRKNLPKLKAFYERFEEERQQDNAQVHLEPKRKIIDTPEAKRIMDEYNDLAEAKDNATSRMAELLADMVRIAGGKEAIFAGRPLINVKRKGSVSYAKAIAALAPGADLTKWTGKESSSWQIK